MIAGDLGRSRAISCDLAGDSEPSEVYRLRGYEMRSLLIGPVFGDDGAVVGLVELVNKTGADGQPDPSGFHRDDERMLQMLCSHCSIFLKNLSGD